MFRLERGHFPVSLAYFIFLLYRCILIKLVSFIGRKAFKDVVKACGVPHCPTDTDAEPVMLTEPHFCAL